VSLLHATWLNQDRWQTFIRKFEVRKILVILTCLLFLGCTVDDPDFTNAEPANNIFQPFFDTFKIEAKKRGHNFDNYELDFYLADIDDDDVSGFASYSYPRIFIDRKNWSSFNYNRREALIFHELGHSILRRVHLNKKTESGECLSYMRGEADFCFRNLYSNLWREYYLNELFDPSSNLPNWYNSNNSYEYNYQNKKYLIQESNNNVGLNDFKINSDTIPKFVLEVNFKNWQSIPNLSLDSTTKINLNGIYFNSQPKLGAFIIGNTDIVEYLKITDYDFSEDIKFTIRKNQNIYQFFLDGQFLHATDIDYLNSNLLDIKFSSEINMDIELYSFE